MKEIKKWKPNLLQKFLYWTSILKDPRYNGKKFTNFYLDEKYA
jgi:hypothetical protein